MAGGATIARGATVGHRHHGGRVVRRFCQVVEAEMLISQSGGSPWSSPPFRRLAPYPLLRPNSRIDSASPRGTPLLTAHAVGGQKCWAIGPYADRNRWAWPGDVNPCMGIVKLTQKIALLCSKERTMEDFELSRAPVFSLFPPPQPSSRGGRLGAIFH